MKDRGNKVVIFESGLVLDEPHEEIFLRISPEGQEIVEHRMQRHEALQIIVALTDALIGLVNEEEK